MWFTRAAMSAARCIKLLHMMGLHRLDDPDSIHEMAPTLAPPKDWTELEGEFFAFPSMIFCLQRRRLFCWADTMPCFTQNGDGPFGAHSQSTRTPPSAQAGLH